MGLKLRNNLRLNGRRVLVAPGLAMVLALVLAGSLPRRAAADDLPTTTAISGPTSAGAGASVTFVATVRGDVADGSPGGTITFTVDGTPLDPVAVTPNADNVTSSATLTTSALATGTHTITATYLPADWTTGNPAPYATSTSAPASISIGSNAPRPTTLVLTSDPSPVQPAKPATFTATVSNGTSVKPVGLVTFDDNGGTIAVVALVDGVATLPNVSGFQEGVNRITATYAGNQLDASVSNSLSFTAPAGLAQLTTRTVLTVSPSGAIHPGDSVQAYATITQQGTGRPSPSGIVSFFVNGRSFPGNQVQLGPDGRTPSVTLTGFDVGANTITAEYVGDENDLASSGSAHVGVVAIGEPLTVATTLSYTGATSAPYGSNVVLKAQLVTANGPVAGELVTLTFAGAQCKVFTDGQGVATCVLPALVAPGTRPVGIEFEGDGLLLPSSGAGSVTVTQQTTTLSYSGVTAVDYGDAAVLSATLTGAGDMTGKLVTFTAGTQQCTGTATSTGFATCTLTTVTQAPGTYTVKAAFAGDTFFTGSDASAPFIVSKEATTATITTVGPVALGLVTLRGTLFEDGLPLAGQTVTLSLGSTTCSAPTNDGGVATCSVVATTLGPAAVGVSFAGNPNYVGSSATIQNGALVYAFAPGTGSFVIGDGNTAPGTAVTFWGAQWAKLNRVSGGAAPDAFKGYASAGSRACGAGWSTGPGNSASPPAGPLPAYMAVLVTSSTGKSGSAISGSTAHIVVVKTDGGYENDPGHAGTGTVVATVC